MQRALQFILVVLSTALMLNFTAFATHHRNQKNDHQMSGQKMDHTKMGGHQMSGMDHSAHRGKNIHNANVDGYQLAYHLIDMHEQMEKMKNMPAMQGMHATHHMMVYVMGPDGKQIDQAKVGYLVSGPDNKKQKLMCTSMKGGFGADVNLKEKGDYSIKTKVVTNGKILLSEFRYEVE